MTAASRAHLPGQQPLTASCSRACPSLPGDSRSLITHRIDVELCMRRQREFYHKCHRCLYRGQPADFVVDEPIQLSPTAETGLPKEHVDLPRARD